MVTYDGAPGELMVGIKEEHHELIGVVVSSYLCLNHPGTHKMIRRSKRRELSKDDTCKSHQINVWVPNSINIVIII